MEVDAVLIHVLFQFLHIACKFIRGIQLPAAIEDVVGCILCVLQIFGNGICARSDPQALR